MSSKRFLLRHPEKAELNQYWYSPHTIDVLVEEIRSVNGSIAFLSTPSLYFALTDLERKDHVLFDFDPQLNKKKQEKEMILYDYNSPLGNIPKHMYESFDMVIIDPPFITKSVWELYNETVHCILKKGGKILCSTIAENEKMMANLMQVEPQVFQPSIPNLVYQYRMFANYKTSSLNTINSEIDIPQNDE